MANNCLLTKLKGSVSNPSLPFEGEVSIHFKGLSIGKMASINENDYSMFKLTGKTTFELQGDAHFVNSDNENIGKKVVLDTDSTAAIYLDSTTELKTLKVYPCWNINTQDLVMNASRGFPAFPYTFGIDNFERLSLMENLTQLSFQYYRGEKTLEELLVNNNYDYFCCSYGFNYLEGNVSAFGNNSKLARLDCEQCPGLTGTIESIIEGLYAKNIPDSSTSVLYKFSGNNGVITLHGAATTNYKVKKDNGIFTIMLSSDDSVVATYNGSTWTYS